MSILGLRIGTSQISLALVSGSQSDWHLDDLSLWRFPKGFEHPLALRWLHSELTDYLQKRPPGVIVIKGVEPLATKSGGITIRTDFEAVAMLVAAQLNIPCRGRRVKASIAKALTGKGKPRYLKTFEPTNDPGFAGRPADAQEAILAALSELD